MSWILTELNPDKVFDYLANVQRNTSHFCCLDNSGYRSKYRSSNWELLAAWNALEVYQTNNDDEVHHVLSSLWNDKRMRFGYLSYELKNAFEGLTSENEPFYPSDLVHFFVPKYMLKIEDGKVWVTDQSTLESLLEVQFNEGNIQTKYWKPIVNKETYSEIVSKLKKHIQRGDIFEINYCIPIEANVDQVDSWKLFNNLRSSSPTPFLSYFQNETLSVISASPERFLNKVGKKLITQPIKGTIKRAEGVEDEALKNQLKSTPKEQTENVMIVDLVRNDLSKVALRNTVEVDELFGIYTFPQVHQMISTVQCLIDEETSLYEILMALFPMGSMTGAPKIEAMKLIDKYESFQRGVYSGSVGYINETDDFDFNVVIRSIIHPRGSENLYFPVGSAITHYANPEEEYEECMLKAKAIVEILTTNYHVE